MSTRSGRHIEKTGRTARTRRRRNAGTALDARLFRTIGRTIAARTTVCQTLKSGRGANHDLGTVGYSGSKVNFPTLLYGKYSQQRCMRKPALKRDYGPLHFNFGYVSGDGPDLDEMRLQTASILATFALRRLATDFTSPLRQRLLPSRQRRHDDGSGGRWALVEWQQTMVSRI